MVRRNAFTRFELILVVFVIVSLLILTLFTPFYFGNELANRAQCANQLQGVAHALHMYHGDYAGQNPIPWNKTKVTKAGFGTGWYNMAGSSKYNRWCDPTWKDWETYPTVGGCIYLLVKYEQVLPWTLVCPSAVNDEEMDLILAIDECKKNGWAIPKDFLDLNDFYSGRNLSYSMNDPWGYPMDASSPGGIAFLADKSNKFDTETFSVRAHTGNSPNYQRTDYWTDEGDKSGSDEGHGNSNNHGAEDQNVLFMDEHVERFETPTVGIEGDNIYTRWDESASPVDTQIGKWGKKIFSAPKKDAYLGN